MDRKSSIVGWISHPNSLTLFRIAAMPLLIILLMFENRLLSVLAAFVFSVAAITDYFDGYVARRYHLVSTLGKIMDPLADKLLVSTAFIMMIPLDRVPAWIICLILGRELAVTGLRNIIAERGEDVAASWLGKFKTGFQIGAIIPLLIHYSFFGIPFQLIGEIVLWAALVITLWSGADYFLRFRRLFEY